MLDIVATCIDLHKLCIVNNKGIKNEWVVEIMHKLAKTVSKGEIWEGSEFWEAGGGTS